MYELGEVVQSRCRTFKIVVVYRGFRGEWLR